MEVSRTCLRQSAEEGDGVLYLARSIQEDLPRLSGTLNGGIPIGTVGADTPKEQACVAGARKRAEAQAFAAVTSDIHSANHTLPDQDARRHDNTDLAV